MYPQGGAILRADLRGVVEQAFGMSDEFIGSRACPPLPVPAKAGQYPVIPISAGNLLRNLVRPRGPASDYSRLTRATSTDTYTCQEYGIEELVDDSENRDYSRFFSLEATAIRLAMRQVQIGHELRVSTLLNARATWTATTSGTAYTAANIASFDLGLDIDVCKQAIAGRGESTSNLTVVMSLNMFNLARASTRIQNRIRGTISTDSMLLLDKQAMADALQVKEVLVAGAFYDTSTEGLASTFVNVWADTNIWVGPVVPAAGPEAYFSGGAAYTLYWDQDSSMWQVETYREDKKRSEVIRARHNVAEKVVNANAGQILATQG